MENPIEEDATSQAAGTRSQSKKQQSLPEETDEQSEPQIVPPTSPQIVINIQLHLPATNDPEIYQNLFKALKENLLS